LGIARFFEEKAQALTVFAKGVEVCEDRRGGAPRHEDGYWK
jgi:hypothetical protein